MLPPPGAGRRDHADAVAACMQYDRTLCRDAVAPPKITSLR
jgi:hypothetical protein